MTLSAPPRRLRREREPGQTEREALIEEARRRARRRRAAYGLSILVAVAAGAGLLAGIDRGGGGRHMRGGDGGRATPAPSPGEQERAIARVARGATFVEAGLVAPGVGWAANGLGLYWTTDSGKHWRGITPPQIGAIGDAVARIVDIAAVGSRHIWVAAADVRGNATTALAGSGRHSALESTSDAGRTWRSAVLPQCDACGATSLSFIDARRGFALARLRAPSRLYRTVDGGRRWDAVGSVPVTGPLVFVDARVGWAVGSHAQALYRTTDGGRTWGPVELRPPQRYAGDDVTVGVPRSFGAGTGVVPVRYRSPNRAQHVVVYTTADGGARWSAHPAPAAALAGPQTWGVPAALPFAAASARVWVLFPGPTLFRTTDGGRSWKKIEPAYAPNAPRVWDVGFGSSVSGWAEFAAGNGAALVATSDGGKTWRPLRPPRAMP
jgi:photosystem II stability/assembly factor-like uncharacterized protein